MTRLSLRVLLQGAADSVVRECVQRWSVAAPGPDGGAAAGNAGGGGGSNGDPGRDGPSNNGTGGRGAGGRSTLNRVAAAMEDEGLVLGRIGTLPRKLRDLLEVFFDDGGAVRNVQALFQDHGGNFKSRFDLEAALAALHREAFLWPVKDKRWASFDTPSWAVPSELAECVRNCRRRRERQLQEALTLQGFLDARYFRERAQKEATGKPVADKDSVQAKAAEAKAADHARKIYKLYTLDNAMAQRLAKLPPTVAPVVDAVLHRHGGIACQDELQRELELPESPDLDLVGKCLEEAMLGTTAALDLARIGIQPLAKAVVVFHEVSLFAIRRRGEQQRPQVGEELSCGGDLATNVGRFLRELQQSKVLFTSEGDLFKASQKRIAGMLLPVPGGFLQPEALLETIFRFCLFRRLIDRRGERSLRPTPAGLEFDRAPLADQVKMMLAHFIEDRTLPGEPFHHTRMRRVLLRLLRRAEPLLWQDVSVLPFLTRNAYLTQLETKPTEEFFAARFQGGGYTPGESLQQMSWNLLVWIKKRLFPLGLVDIGMHQGRVTALRLSRLGAELLDTEPAGKVGGTRCTVIVQPDFEILVFPGDDVHDVVHLFDRFARRTKSDHVHQFTIDQDSVKAGIEDGLSGPQIVQELMDRARVPVPQNVIYSLEEWAQRRSG